MADRGSRVTTCATSRGNCTQLGAGIGSKPVDKAERKPPHLRGDTLLESSRANIQTHNTLTQPRREHIEHRQGVKGTMRSDSHIKYRVVAGSLNSDNHEGDTSRDDNHMGLPLLRLGYSSL